MVQRIMENVLKKSGDVMINFLNPHLLNIAEGCFDNQS